jgi:hypothetical protein
MAKGLPAYGLPSPVKPAAGPGAALVDAASSRLRAVYAAHKVPVILLYYGLCSSTLIVINKLAVHSVQAPVFILMTQLLVAAGAVLGAKAAGWVDAEPLRWQLVRPFTLIILGFLGTLYANIQVLAYSNVETFITFRWVVGGSRRFRSSGAPRLGGSSVATWLAAPQPPSPRRRHTRTQHSAPPPTRRQPPPARTQHAPPPAPPP